MISNDLRLDECQQIGMCTVTCPKGNIFISNKNRSKSLTPSRGIIYNGEGI